MRGLKLGAEDYITKPFELEELFARVETVLRRRKKSSVSEINWHNIRIEDEREVYF